MKKIITGLLVIILILTCFIFKLIKQDSNGVHISEIAKKISTETIINVEEQGADSTGFSDSTKSFQKAIDSLGKSGGIIFIPKGTFLLDQIQIPSYVQLVGSGKGTILKSKPNSDKPLIVLKSKTAQMVYLRDFTIDGNREYQSSSKARGIEFINTRSAEEMKKKSILKEHDARHYIENIYISETKGDGLYIEGRGESQIKGLQVLRSDGIGIHSNAQDNWFTDCSSGESGIYGIFVGDAATNSRYVNCKAWFSGRVHSDQGDGFHITASRVALTGSEAQDNSKHGFVFAGSDIVGYGLLAEANGWQYGTRIRREDGTGFVFYGAINCNIQGVAADRFVNSKEKSHQTFAIQLINQSRGNHIDVTSRGMRLNTIPSNQLNNDNKINITDSKEIN
ncbi:glycosyl hydrolase family 28-related protein [Bacillus albus]|uniref:glycosyl hydrolase family 28-related protein n=1 Tax=Bacillus cereus group TaxID=86661 RepID=UPI0022E5629D|nr:MULTISPECIES: glycosyl hydrolase family 28-related protein [Bacillus cereus group]MDA2216890.1 glycosyl hydrolase family 28-related protein [Bacillus cereus group sp. Bc228]MDA2226171.1 glycosyl hydrolase family 28-related protein [Bacillus cereus group sp. Bc227]